MKKLLFTTLTLLGLAGAAQACPNWNLNPNYGSFNVSVGQLRAGQQLSLTAGGDNYVWNCRNVTPQTDEGAGYFTSQPDFSFNLSGMGGLRLVISAVSECDSALLINTASAGWYYDDDDNGNLDPKIVLTRPANGRIDIWMGTYDGEYCNARLRMETFAR